MFCDCCGFDASFHVPQLKSNGLKTISRTNCLSEASFCPAGFHLFVFGNPAQQGKALGRFLLLSFSLSIQRK
jgi:hypothetical protein